MEDSEVQNVMIVRQGPELSPVQVFLNGKELSPRQSQKVLNHSPGGFNAGYTGSGPAQTALAILLELMDRKEAVRYHQSFKNQFLANSDYQEQGTFNSTGRAGSNDNTSPFGLVMTSAPSCWTTRSPCV